MLKDFIDMLQLSNEAKIAVVTACITISATAAGTYYACDKFIFSERTAVLNEYKSEIDSLRSTNGNQQKMIDQYSAEITRLRTYEQMLPEYKKALDDERVRSAGLEAQINQIGQGSRDIKQVSDSCSAEVATLKSDNARLNDYVRRVGPFIDKQNQIRDLEENKNSVEVKLAELEWDHIYSQFNAEKIAQLRRVSSEYQQRILALQQCEK
ncbi:hypothetical protein [Burkholderia gladioli]|uniref:hypothetical protein n=1 Tax=Burkholderia gladioli TaxID=28095 RepID=UPI00264DF9FD|nr:hypothetical protein [Burkholderia gladioli]MDN7753089.1 hypothetical protein [Burkholderia gladioli]